MYSVEWEPGVQEQTLSFNYEGTLDFADTLAGIMIDPWNFRRRPDEPVGSHYAHRTVEFADGNGLVMFLILEYAAEVHITGIAWLG